MAMTVMNNSAAMLSLGELNKNITEMGKRQKKLSSGMKINSAGDDASSYAISERMRAQLRSLDQDEQNVKNGASLLKVGDGGISNIVDELRNLKELAINAANDSNTDADRAIIQKEFNEKMANIDDIASTTNFNGINLLDGTWKRPTTHVVTRPVIPNSYNVTVDGDNIANNSITGFFANSGFSQATANATNGKTEDSGAAWINGRQVLEGRSWTPYTLDFSGACSGLSLPGDINGQGFTIFCAGNSDTSSVTMSRFDWCADSHSFIFDASLPVGISRTGRTDNIGDYGGVHRSFVIGIAGVENSDDLVRAFYEGIRSAVGGNSENQVDIVCHTDILTFKHNSDNTYSMDRNWGMWLYEGYPTSDYIPDPPPNEENMLVTDDYHPLVIQSGTKSAQNINLFINDMHIDALKSDIPNESDVERLEKYLPGSSLSTYQNTIHEMGITESASKIGILDGIMDRLVESSPGFASSSNYKKYMEYRDIVNAAGSAQTLDNVKVITQKDASVAIRVVDSAIEYALNEATYVGAYISRMGFTESNIVTSSENTQSAESVIRDSDMAKEMTNFTKSSILSQSAQAMLAQANQVGSQALSLLQQ